MDFLYGTGGFYSGRGSALHGGVLVFLGCLVAARASPVLPLSSQLVCWRHFFFVESKEKERESTYSICPLPPWLMYIWVCSVAVEPDGFWRTRERVCFIVSLLEKKRKKKVGSSYSFSNARATTICTPYTYITERELLSLFFLFLPLSFYPKCIYRETFLFIHFFFFAF